MAAAALLHENVWVDRFRVEDAEYAYHQALASQRAGLVVQVWIREITGRSDGEICYLILKS